MFTKGERIAIYFLAGTLIGVFLMLAFVESVSAHDITVNNHYHTTEVTEITEVTDVTNMRITDSLSESDMIEIIGSSIAAGSHQFDWVTTRWQISVTGATQTSDWDEDTSFSFAIGKRFGKEHWMPNALWHLGYTPDIAGNDYISGGATIVLGE